MNEPLGLPILRIVRGEPTDEEVAALVVALGALSGPERRTPTGGSAWSDPASLLRRPIHPGPDAWRRSALPR